MFDLKHPRANSPSSGQLGHGNTHDVVNTLDQTLSKGYLCGDRFSAADLFMAASVHWWLFTKVLEARPAFEKYVALCQDRPAVRSHMTKTGSFRG